MASFDDKVEALKKLREKRLARQEAAAREEGASLKDAVSSEEALARKDAASPKSELQVPTTAGRQGQVPEVSNRTAGYPAAPSGRADDLPQAAEPEEPLMAMLRGLPVSAQADPDMLFCAGHCHENGLHDCDVDKRQAAEFYEMAAEQGLAMAQWRLGELLEAGHGIAKDEAAAAGWYRKAAEQGHRHAQSALALLLEDGRGLARDDAEAFSWHLAAAEQGLALSQYCASCCLAEGRGTPEDSTAARCLLEQSAAGGFPPAVEDLERAKLRVRNLVPGTAAASTVALPASGSLSEIAERVARQLVHLSPEEAKKALDDLLADPDGPFPPDELDAQSGSEDDVQRGESDISSHDAPTRANCPD